MKIRKKTFYKLVRPGKKPIVTNVKRKISQALKTDAWKLDLVSK